MTATTESISTPSKNENLTTWKKLWELASVSINWNDGTIDFDSFSKEGQELFDLKIKNIVSQ